MIVPMAPRLMAWTGAAGATAALRLMQIAARMAARFHDDADLRGISFLLRRQGGRGGIGEADTVTIHRAYTCSIPCHRRAAIAERLWQRIDNETKVFYYETHNKGKRRDGL